MPRLCRLCQNRETPGRLPGYDKKSQVIGIAKIMEALKIDKADRITHDIDESGVITNSGHWIMEEQPAQTVKLVSV